MKLRIGMIFSAIMLCASLAFGAWTLLAGADDSDSRYDVPFELTDDLGAPITEQAFEGRPSLVYFGYTHCPEICPTTLYEMAGWMKTLDPAAKELKAFFFTVDPERDTVEVMHGYTSNFTDRITGITGNSAEMQKVIKGWQIFVRKVPTSDGDYTYDHTASVFLVDSKGYLKDTIEYGEDTNSALTKIRTFLKSELTSPKSSS
ncbi:SCO family protein [Brucella cytisi]|uniref:SCO family protein n=1 Tax=Brucella cytisi TaxID=407152 RepID=UPI0035DD050C